MSRKRIIYIAIALGLMVGNSLLFGSWFFPEKDLGAQCTQLFLDSGPTDPPPCSGGTLLSSTLGSGGSGPYGGGGAENYVALCIY